MKKILIVLVVVFLCSGCSYKGYDFIDTNYHFDRAIIKMPDGSIEEIKIKKWADSDDGEQLTITSEDGKKYLVSSVNCILIKD